MRFELAALALIAKGVSSDAKASVLDTSPSDNQKRNHKNDGAELKSSEQTSSLPVFTHGNLKGKLSSTHTISAKELRNLNPNADRIVALSEDDSEEFKICSNEEIGILHAACSSPDESCVPLRRFVAGNPSTRLHENERQEVGVCLPTSQLNDSSYEAISYDRNLQVLDCDSVCGSDRKKIYEDGEAFQSLIAEAQSEPDLINCWDTSEVTNMTRAFFDLKSFNSALECWDTSNVEAMNGMFGGATSFNMPIGNWDTSKVTNMEAMFYMANEFNQPLGDWDTGQVTSMYAMFALANKFNQPIEDWNVSNVYDMASMFFVLLYGSYFNQKLDSWDVSSVYYMQSMFSGANSFNQCLGTWGSKTPESVGTEYMLYGTACPLGDGNPNPSVGPWCQGSQDECFDLEACVDDEEFSFTNKGQEYKCTNMPGKFCKKKTVASNCPSKCSLACKCEDKKKYKIKGEGKFLCAKVEDDDNPTCNDEIKPGLMVRDECPKACESCLLPQ